MHTHTPKHTHTCTRTNTYTCTHMPHMHSHTQHTTHNTQHTQTQIHIHMHTHMHIYTHTHTHKTHTVVWIKYEHKHHFACFNFHSDMASTSMTRTMHLFEMVHNAMPTPHNLCGVGIQSFRIPCNGNHHHMMRETRIFMVVGIPASQTQGNPEDTELICMDW